MYGPWPGQWDEFIDDIFLGGLTMCGDWFEVTRSWLEAKETLGSHLMTFENILRQPEQEIRSLAKYLELEITDEQLEVIMFNCKFDTMQSDPDLNITFDTGFRFLRKGQVRLWNNTNFSEHRK